MSLESWIKEFYPKGATLAANRSDQECLKHSIQKWTGVLPENLKKHKMDYDRYYLFSRSEEEQPFSFSGISCALCQKYDEPSPDDGDMDCYSENEQDYCPIVRVTGQNCNEVYHESSTDPTLMIELLQKTLEAIKS